MKNSFLLFLFIFSKAILIAQEDVPKKIHNEKFNWNITIPMGFQYIEPEVWAAYQQKGEAAIEDTYGEEIINQAKTIFAFKADQFNYFESNYQPYDLQTDGDYIETCKAVNEILYETFKAQMPDIKIDSSFSSEFIDSLEFQKFAMKIEYPNAMVMQVYMYSRLFGNNELTINLMAIDPFKGQLMMDAFKSSKFGPLPVPTSGVFSYSICEPLNPMIIQKGEILHEEMANVFHSFPWSDYLAQIEQAKESEIYYSPSLEFQNQNNKQSIIASAVGDPDEYEFYLFYRFPNTKSIPNPQTGEVEAFIMYEIRAQKHQDFLNCIRALIEEDTAYLRKKFE